MANEKNVIILKNLSSNLVEEAIVILKDNVKSKKIYRIKNDNNEMIEKYKMEDSKEYILKEAELIISNYMDRLNNNTNYKDDKEQFKIRYKRLRFFTIVTSSVFFALLLIRMFIK